MSDDSTCPWVNTYGFLYPIFDAFEAAGHEIYLVGGCVRDWTLNRRDPDNHFAVLNIHDFDLVTSAPLPEISRLLEAAGAAVTPKTGGNANTLYSRFAGRLVDVSTYSGATLEEDLMMRDFTMNAQALDRNGTHHGNPNHWIDMLEGDLITPMDPMVTFGADPLRILRMYRFAHQFDFDLEAGVIKVDQRTREAARELAPSLRKVAPERIQSELVRIAGNPNPHLAFEEMMNDGVMEHVLVNLLCQVGFDQDNKHHHLPLWEHTLKAVEHGHELGANALTILALLLHDVAKPLCHQYTYECGACGKKETYPQKASDLGVALMIDGVEHAPQYCKDCWCGSPLRYYGRQYRKHDTMGANIARSVMERLRFSEADTSAVSQMIACHIDYQHGDWSLKAMRRFVNKLGDLHGEMVKFLKADRLAHAPGWDDVSDLETLERLLFENAESVVDAQRIKLPVNGRDVMSACGLQPGPEVGQILGVLTELYVDQEVTTREEMLAKLASWKGPSHV